MGDVEGSSELDSNFVKQSLNHLVEEINKEYGTSILSPLTITLGDEFQGIAVSNTSALEVIFGLETFIMKQALPFRLHYVLYEGEIDTEINTETAYGMLGSGLTNARGLLTSKKRDRKRFQIHLQDSFTGTQVEKLMEVASDISESWKVEDFALILEMLEYQHNQTVADTQQKTRTQIWKRRKTLQIEAYRNLTEVAYALIETTK